VNRHGWQDAGAPELQARTEAPTSPGLPVPADATLAEVECYWIGHMLARCGGNKTEAARRLGIYPSTLHRKLRSGPGA